MRILTLISREENEALKKELRDIQSRLSEDHCKTNVRIQQMMNRTKLICYLFEGVWGGCVPPKLKVKCERGILG